MIPSDLLDQIREKDPELYENIAKSFAWAELQYDELYPEYVGDKPHLPDEIEIDNHMDHLIQGCLQEAIRARGWYLTQWTQSDPIFPEIECVIHCPIKKEVPSGYKGSLFNDYFGRGDTEAEALLQAYLSALSASQ